MIAEEREVTMQMKIRIIRMCLIIMVTPVSLGSYASASAPDSRALESLTDRLDHRDPPPSSAP